MTKSPIVGRVADLELSTVHHQQARDRLSGRIDDLPLFGEYRAGEVRNTQLFLTGEALEDRDAGDAQVILGHDDTLSHADPTRP